MAYEPYNPSFGIGARVKVVRNRKYPKEKLKDLIGTVRTDSGCNVSVIFDTVKNPRNSYGAFYFKAADLVKVDEFDNEIKEEHNMEKITNYLNVARVTYPGANAPAVYYYANFEPDLKVGDLCVVTYANNRLDVAEVAEILEDIEVETYNEIVAKVHTGGYETRVECRKKAAELKAKMETRAKQLQDIALYQMLAKDDPEMAALLNEYQGLPKV